MANDKAEIISDKDVIKFLKTCYFGDLKDPLEAASSRAYRDMARTIRFKDGLSDSTKKELRKKVSDVFDPEIKKLNLNSITSQDDFDTWHRQVSNIIKKTYKDEGITLTYGQTQKWINMTIKYLYVLGENTFDDVFGFLHIPLDNYIFDIASKILEVDRPTDAWSSLDDYDKYLEYQKSLREKMVNDMPLSWEFKNWQKATQNH